MDIDFFITITLYLLIILLIHHYINKTKIKKPNTKPKKILKPNNVVHNNNNNIELDTNTFDDFASQSTQSNQSNNNSENDMIINTTELNNLNSITSKDELLKYLDLEKKEQEDTLNSVNLSNDNKSLNSYFNESNNKYEFLEVPTLDDFNISDLKKLKDNENDNKLFGEVLAFDDFDDNHALIN